MSDTASSTSTVFKRTKVWLLAILVLIVGIILIKIVAAVAVAISVIALGVLLLFLAGFLDSKAKRSS